MNQDVIALRDEFAIPADDHRFRVINADGAAYVSALTHSKDVILADACDSAGIAVELDSVEFYRQVRGRLSDGGVFVTNLCGDKFSTSGHLTKLRDAFDDQLLSLQVEKDSNVVVFAFKERRPDLHWEGIEASAPDLKRRFRLDFPRYARRIAVDSKLHEARAARGA